ncbi:MAG: AAA-like domain-containing protein [Pyrinomonadaceae bacterium]
MPEQKIFSVEGGSVQANDGLYIHRGADEELLELCRAGAFTYVLTPRQMGKSSLMVRTAERLSDEGFTSIIIDLQELGVELTAEQWYYGLVAKIDERSSLRTNAKQWWKEHEALGFGQRLVLFLKDVLMAEAGPEERVVIFVDEIDTTLSLKFSDDFFTAVRAIYGSRASDPRFRRLSFVLIGVATPSDLISDPKRTPFNIGQRVDLTDFTNEEALPLARGLGLPPAEARDVLGWALAWTGGHPFLTQQLCAAIEGRGKSGWTRADVDAVVAEHFLGEDFAKNSNLLFVRDMLTKRAPDRESVLNTYDAVLRGNPPVSDEGQSVPKAHLKLSGVVCAEDGTLRVRNPIYRGVFDERWVRKHNPPNWTKRLTRVAAALVAAVLFLMLPVGVFALYQWRQAVHQAEFAQQQTDIALHQSMVAEAARKDAEEQRGIAEARRVEADKQRALAEEARAEAEASAGLEKKAKTEVEAERNKALAAAAEAQRQRQNAERERAIADQLRQEAVAQTHVVEKQKKTAEQAQLISQSLSAQRAGDYQHAVLLAREALRRDRFDIFSVDAYQALGQGLSLLPRPVSKYEGLSSDAALSEDGQYLLSALREHWPVRTQEAYALAPRARRDMLAVYDAQNRETDSKAVAGLSTVVFSPDKKYLLTSDANTRGLSYGNVPLNSNFPFNSEANNAGNVNSNVSTNANRSSSNNGPAAANRPFTAKVWEWNGGSLKESAGGLVLGIRVETVALGPGGKLIALARRPPVALARGRAAFIYRPASFLLGGARAASSQQQRQEVNAPVIELRKVDEPAARPEVLVAPLRLGPSPVAGLAFSGDGRRLALAQEDGTWVVWADDDGKGFRPLTHGTQDDPVTALAISPDGKRLATAGRDNAVRVWGLSSASGWDSHAEFRRSGFADVVFAGMYADLEEKTGQEGPFSVIRGHTSTVNALAFAPDAEYLATAGEDGTARLWRVTDKAEEVEVARISHEGPVEGVSFGAGGSRLVTASADGTVRVWEVPGAAGSLGEVVFAGANVETMSPNRKFILLSDQKEFRVWDVAEGKFAYRVDGKSGVGRLLLAAVSAPSLREPTVFLGDDGRHLIAFTTDGEAKPPAVQPSTGWWMRLLDLAENREVWKKEGEVPGFVGVTFSPNGKYLSLSPSGGADGTTVILDLRDGKQVLSLDAQEREEFNFECFTSDGDHVVLGRRDENEKGIAVRVLEVRGGRKVGEWRAESQPVLPLVSGGGAVKGGYVGGVDGKGVVTVWEAFSGHVVNRMELARADIYSELLFSPDGEHFAVPSRFGVSVWKVGGAGERPLANILSDSPNVAAGSAGFFFNTTGELLSRYSSGGTTVWNALTGCEVARIEAAGNAYVNAGGARVLTVDSERSGAVWRKFGLNDLLAEVCTHVTRNLTLSEWRNDYRLSADAPPLKCENIKQDEKEEAAVSEQVNSCDLSGMR